MFDSTLAKVLDVCVEDARKANDPNSKIDALSKGLSAIAKAIVTGEDLLHRSLMS